MSDTNDLAYRTLVGVLETIEPGTLWTSDVWFFVVADGQPENDQVTSAEKAAAQDRAVREGLAERIIVEVDGRTAAVQVPSLVPSRKRGAVQLLRRTSPVQPAPVDAPGTLFEAVGA